MADKLRFGANAKLYRDTASNFSSPTLVAVTVVHESLSIDSDKQPKDATTRRANTVVEVNTRQKVRVKFKVVEDLGDAGFLALRAAHIADTIICFVVCSGAVTDAGETYIKFDAQIFTFMKSEPIDGINTYDVELGPTYSPNLTVQGITPIS